MTMPVVAQTSANESRRVLVTGGAGYLGCVLVPRLLERGHRVRVLDCLQWGRRPLAGFADHVELVEADVRDADATARALEGIDGVVLLAGLSNDATAERDPERSWRTNALAAETLARTCLERGPERVVLASSCCLYDGLPSRVHDEESALCPRGVYAISKRYAEEALLSMVCDGLCPVVLRNGTMSGWSPRMRYDLVVNTLVKDALLEGRLSLHGGGWMRRPLVDVRDAADAAILALEAPAELVRGEIFNVVHSNHRIREVATIVAGAVQLLGRRVELRETGAPALARDYSCSNAKLASRLGFSPTHSVADSVEEVLARIDPRDPWSLRDARHYNARWLAPPAGNRES